MKTEIEKILQEEQEFMLQISCDRIEQEADGKAVEGSFVIQSSQGKNIKGKIFVTDPRIVCSEIVFQKEEVKISYSFDSSCMEPGETVSGSFEVITNCGESQIPFSFHYPEKILKSSLGEIKNLFHFTNLARSNWKEALDLFFSANFEKVLENAEKEYREIYRGLSAKRSEQHMEEFLQAIHKKEPVRYLLEEKKLDLENIEEPERVEIMIQKNGWGYNCLEIESEGEFFSFTKEILTEEDFVENECRFSFFIFPGVLHQGKNWGKIYIRSLYETIEIPVFVYQKQHHRMRTAIEKRRNAKWLNAKLTAVYVEFRRKNLGTEGFRQESEEILGALQKSDERNPLIKLYGAHLYLAQENRQEAKRMLDRAARMIQEEKNPVIYAYYLYLTALMSDKEEDVNQVKEQVKDLHDEHWNNWRISWLWMYLSKELRGNAQKKWEFLKKVFLWGCISPVMYLEAVLLLIYQPTLLTELGETELRILWFGQKKGMLTPELKGIIQYLVMKEKEFSGSLYRLLAAIYKEEENEEILQALCGLLIKGNQKGNWCLEWYEKAILAGIKITRLYEYYMMSLEGNKEKEIPRAVLLYFSYQTELAAEYTAYLYRYIYENREQMEDLYSDYYPNIERFMLKNLYAGKIDEDLGYLYEHILIPEMMTEDNAVSLIGVMFWHQISYPVAEGEKLAVLQEQVQKEEVYQGNKNGIRFPLYHKNYLLFREDKSGNRFLWKEKEPPRSFLNLPYVAEQVFSWKPVSFAIAMYLCSKNGEWESITWEKEEYFRFLCEAEEVKTEDKMVLRGRMMDFYYEMDSMEKLDCLLEGILPFSVRKEERKKLLQYFVIREYYEKAYEFIKVYGIQNIDPKILVRVSTYMLEEEKGEDEFLLWYITGAFHKGKYNVIMLKYLLENYWGNSWCMKEIFMAARNFELPAFPLNERLLKQILTTKAFIGDEIEIFKDCVACGTKTEIEAAFLTYRSVQYMKNDREMDPYLVMDIGRVHRRGYQLPLVTHLAYLRYFAQQKEERHQAQQDTLREFLHEIVIEKEMLLPFLMEYSDQEGMEVLSDKTIVCYRTVPGSRVVIHYRKIHAEDKKSGFQKEEMKEVCFGIYVKECILFYGEELQYYITEEQENKEQLTMSGTIQKEEAKEKHKNSRYQLINEMAIGQTLQDYDFVNEGMEEYWKMEFLTDKIFRL